MKLNLKKTQRTGKLNPEKIERIYFRRIWRKPVEEHNLNKHDPISIFYPSTNSSSSPLSSTPLLPYPLISPEYRNKPGVHVSSI